MNIHCSVAQAETVGFFIIQTRRQEVVYAQISVFSPKKLTISLIPTNVRHHFKIHTKYSNRVLIYEFQTKFWLIVNSENVCNFHSETVTSFLSNVHVSTFTLR